MPKVSSLLPSNKNRSLLVHTLVKEFGLLTPNVSDGGRVQAVRPTPANVRELTIYHDREFVEHLLSEKGSELSNENEDHGLEEVCLYAALSTRSYLIEAIFRTVQYFLGLLTTSVLLQAHQYQVHLLI